MSQDYGRKCAIKGIIVTKIIERTDVEYLRQVGIRAAKQSRIYMNQIDLVLPFSAKVSAYAKGSLSLKNVTGPQIDSTALQYSEKRCDRWLPSAFKASLGAFRRCLRRSIAKSSKLLLAALAAFFAFLSASFLPFSDFTASISSVKARYGSTSWLRER